MAAQTTTNAAVANRTAVALQSGFETYVPMGQAIFNDTPPTRKDEIFSVHAHDGSFSAVGEGGLYPSVDILEAGTKTLSQLVYKKQLAITELMQVFDHEGKIMKEAFRIGLDAAIKIDQLQADVLNGGFATETTWDGDYIFSATHNIGNTGVTQSNLVSGAFTDSTLNDAIVALNRQKNHRNTPQPILPATLVVPVALRKKAVELVESPGNPEAANLNINTHKAYGIQVVAWPLLDATSSTAWFLMGPKAQHEFHKLMSISPEVEVRERKYTSHGGEEVRLQFALQAGAADYLGAVGSLGT